ncbi:ribosomal oxygenase 1 isoform X1 [Ooceraea biroi]|uniref:ribosomal oxygenase 1 isoform X1 n=1 Tax=Ooceraea biroi TaxID=2015173 RepID=UPI000F07FE27|nr:ribosomal oxygenase 1 isoform X1 [Ooceraea biroi]XP_026830432.1 ribosomal oxygenase 1 isoform X1 [Ooceraea biroi]
MSENTEPVSAFSIYKRKSTEQPLSPKKRKSNHSRENKATGQKIVAENAVKDIPKKRQSKQKCTLNVTVKNKDGVVTKAGNLRVFKNNFLPTVKKAQFVQREYKVDETQQLKETVETDSVQRVHKKSKLKKKKVKSKVEKEEDKMNSDNGEAKESPTENYETQGNDSLNHYKDIECDDPENLGNPIESSRKLFEWLISPLKVEDFFADNWESTPVHIQRKDPNYYEHLMSTPLLDQVLREHDVFFNKNIDVTSYIDGERETHNPPGRALPSVIWDYYRNKCSVRMLNPQTFIPQLHALNGKDVVRRSEI